MSARVVTTERRDLAYGLTATYVRRRGSTADRPRLSKPWPDPPTDPAAIRRRTRLARRAADDHQPRSSTRSGGA